MKEQQYQTKGNEELFQKKKEFFKSDNAERRYFVRKSISFSEVISVRVTGTQLRILW